MQWAVDDPVTFTQDVLQFGYSLAWQTDHHMYSAVPFCVTSLLSPSVQVHVSNVNSVIDSMSLLYINDVGMHGLDSIFVSKEKDACFSM